MSKPKKKSKAEKKNAKKAWKKEAKTKIKASAKTKAKRKPATTNKATSLVEKAVFKARTKANLSQKKVAKEIGVGPMYLSNCERGRNHITPRRFKKVSKALKIPLNKLIDLRVADFKSKLLTQVG